MLLKILEYDISFIVKSKKNILIRKTAPSFPYNVNCHGSKECIGEDVHGPHGWCNIDIWEVCHLSKKHGPMDPTLNCTARQRYEKGEELFSSCDLTSSFRS